MNAAELTHAIREAAENHDPTVHGHATQWYVDENAVDCDADEFWKVVEQTLRRKLGEGDE